MNGSDPSGADPASGPEAAAEMPSQAESSSTGPSQIGAGPKIDRRMLEALVCPVSHVPLLYDARRQELISEAAQLAFPIRDGIPFLLVDEARELD